jgi:hypothetical protein
MLEQANSLLLHELVDHVAQYRSNGVETFVGLANVGKANVIE